MTNRLLIQSELPLPLLLLSLALPLTGSADEEFFETLPGGARPPVVSGPTSGEAALAGAAQQSPGALTGRVVFTSAGHGWTWGRSSWSTQRGVGHEMNEDYGNLDQMNFFVPYAINAGATVVAFRPIGYQTHEVVLDNDSAGVKFSGKWFESRSTIFYGRAGAVPYRFAPLDKLETATATYTPTIPAAGFYPVYTWARHGPDRTSQLYRILHTGGQSLVRVPHHQVGSGWVYLGTYYFNAGADRKRGSVVVSNLQPSPGFGAVAIADAIRFGNGMGDIVPASGAPISTYPREEEAARYWVLKSLGQGQTNVISLASSDQQSSNVSAPIRLARAMNRDAEGNQFKRIYLSFHSNSGGGRGAIGLWNNPKLFPGTKTPNQERLAQLVGAEITNTFWPLASPPLEVPWSRRTTLTYARDDYAFGEINNKVIEDKFDATILEVAFHDSNDDARLMRDPKVRDTVARCSFQAVVRYMNEFDGCPLQFLPDPPRNPRATSAAGIVTTAWDPPADCSRNPVESYQVYRSENGYGFGSPVRVAGGQTSLTLPKQRGAKAAYYRVTAVNAGGESLPSTVVGCLPAARTAAPRVLFVNGFTEYDRLTNPRQTLAPTNYLPPSAVGRMDRVIPRLNNGFDYVVQHGQALAAKGGAFDSCEREAVSDGMIQLEKYRTVIWASGKQTTNLFTPGEQQALARHLQRGGSLFVSGARVGQALQSTEGDGVDLAREFHVTPADPSGAAARFLSFLPVESSIFRREAPGLFGDAGDQSYYINGVSRLLPAGPGARSCLLYPDSSGAAAVQYDGSAGGGRVVCFGFPFECIASARERARLLADILRFFDSSPSR